MVKNTCKYNLGGIGFSNWQEVTEKVRSLFAKGKRKLKGKNLKFVLDLLEYHPHSEVKKQNGIKAIEVGEPEYGTHLCFIIVDNDGNKKDFSYKKCTPTTKTNPQKVLASIEKRKRFAAYRDAVSTQILDFMVTLQEYKCAICKSKSNIQVDHKHPSLVQLINAFEANYKPSCYPDIERCKSIQTMCFKPENEESHKFIKAWQEFHQQNASFQLLCRTCNLKKQNRVKYIPYLN